MKNKRTYLFVIILILFVFVSFKGIIPMVKAIINQKKIVSCEFPSEYNKIFKQSEIKKLERLQSVKSSDSSSYVFSKFLIKEIGQGFMFKIDSKKSINDILKITNISSERNGDYAYSGFDMSNVNLLFSTDIPKSSDYVEFLIEKPLDTLWYGDNYFYGSGNLKNFSIKFNNEDLNLVHVEKKILTNDAKYSISLIKKDTTFFFMLFEYSQVYDSNFKLWEFLDFHPTKLS